jgi:hypothetical protein
MAFSGVLLQGSECRWLGILQNLLFNRLEDPFFIKEALSTTMHCALKQCLAAILLAE